MNQKELTKTFMMISNWKTLWSPWFVWRIVQRSRVNFGESLVIISAYSPIIPENLVQLCCVFWTFGGQSVFSSLKSSHMSYSGIFDLFEYPCYGSTTIPANTRCSPIVEVLLARRCRRQANITSTMGERLVFAGIRNILILSVRDSDV